jgi:NADPH:quinone reductase-like Zn-dependent oxidoreductase
MKALVYDYDVPDKMTWEDNHPIPEPPYGHIKVKIMAASLNPFDYKIPDIPGLARARRETPVGSDFSGKVVKIAAGVTGIKEGDFVFGSTSGSLAEYCIAKQCNVAVLPDKFNVEEAAAYPLAALTAYQGLKIAEVIGCMQAKKVLILGAAGGVGHFAVQMAKKCASPGNHIVGVCAREHEDFVKSLGANETFDYTKRGFDVSHCVCDCDVVLDTVSHAGFDYEAVARKCLKYGGKYVATNSANTSDWVRASISSTVGLNFQRGGYHLFMTDVNTDDLKKIASHVAKNELKVCICKKVNFGEKECFDAMDTLMSSRMKGKILISMGTGAATL